MGTTPVIKNAIFKALDKATAGLTCDEMEEITKIGHSSCSACVSTMMRNGFLTKLPTTRMTRWGKPAAIYVRSGQQVSSPFQDLLKLTVDILQAVPAKKRAPLAQKVAELVKASK